MKPTETTAALIEARNQLIALNLDVLFLSGIDVALYSYTEGKREHLRRVTLHAEDFAPVKEALQECVRLAIERRKDSLRRDLADIDAKK
ncbi:hypothetical protein HDE76_000738 [Rhodanobacter sp. ANJX3]|uniref:hypothetical protein n=1 Tax=Rhodanobacter sp. ANJX3 TaxID=2723083 RepID=UPI00160C2D1B|nr:hypothetical protein [Rhodanobacter sp. ANJX3]MBB5357556.1 hypothetical protein [Rhodanobacter sp. ANJX3]